MLSAVQLIAPASVAVQPARAATVDLHYGYLQILTSLNPFRGITASSYEFYGMVYDYLFSVDQDGNLVPNLATGATCDASCQNWTYTIRQGVKWSDGSDFTADDVNFTLNYNIANFFQLWAYEPYVNRIVQCSSKTRPYCGAVQTGPWQVTVYFDRSFVPGRALFLPIIQKAQWQGYSPSQAQAHFENPNPIGTGLFVADANVYNQWLNDQPIVLHRNPNYHPVGNHTGPSPIDNIYMQQFHDESILVASVETGAIDVADLTPAGYDGLANKPNVGRQEALLSTQYWNEIGISQFDSASVKLNPARFDMNLRRALAMATNKDYILQTIYRSKGLRGDSLISPITPQWWYDPTADPGVNLTFNIQAANALLNASGYTTWTGGSFEKGFRAATNDIDVWTQTNAYPNGTVKVVPAGTVLSFTMVVRQEFVLEQDTATYLKAQWAQIGFNVNIRVELESTLAADIYGGAVEMYIYYWAGDPDPNYLLSIESRFTLDGWNDNYWNNATYNSYYVTQLAQLNFTQRQYYVRQAEKLQYESAVYLIYIYPYGEWAYRTDHFTGWGDWKAHPYRQINAFWSANPLFFDLQPNHPPTVPTILGTPPVTAFVNRAISFVGNSTDIDSSEALAWTWNWGDGTYTVHTSGSGVADSQDSASHAWSTVGAYNVTLSVSDGAYNETSAPFQVDVIPIPAGGLGWINGTVTGASGAPLLGATVRTTPANFYGVTDSQGRYTILVAAGTYDVTASAEFYGSQTVSNVVVDKDAAVTVDFELASNRGWITGTVSSTSNAPLANAQILAVGTSGRQFTTTTDSRGEYNLSFVPGTYNVTANQPGYVGKTKSGVVVNDGQTTTADFQLEAVSSGVTGLSPPVLAGIGTAVVVAAIAVVAFLLSRRRKLRKNETKVEIPKK